MIYSKIKGRCIPNKKYELMIEKFINRIIKHQKSLQPLQSEIIKVDDDYGSYYDNFVDGRGF